MSLQESTWMVNADDTDFESKVIQGSKERPVVVDFWAPWCAPCRALAPILEKAVQDTKGEVVLVKVNVDESPGVAAQFQIQSIPLVIAFQQGRPVNEFVGIQPAVSIEQFLKTLLPSPVDRLVSEAKTLGSANAKVAEEKLRQAMELDRHHEPARVALAGLLADRSADADALQLLEEVGEIGPAAEEAARIRGIIDLRRQASGFAGEAGLRKVVEKEPKNAQARYELGCVLAATQKYSDALEMLLSAAELDQKIAAGPARQKMVEIFHIVGDRSDLANDYREKLSTLLY
jgi:putative thioredoxin